MRLWLRLLKSDFSCHPILKNGLGALGTLAVGHLGDIKSYL